MNDSRKYPLMILVALTALVLSACGSAPETQAPTDLPPVAETQAPPPTDIPAPTATPEPVATPPGGGGMIGFVSDRVGSNALYFIAPSGGQALLQSGLGGPIGQYQYDNGGYPFSWAMPCGEKVAYASFDAALGRNYVEIFDLNTGQPTRIQTGPITGLNWSPTCRMLLWTQDGVGAEGLFTKGTFVYDLASEKLSMFNLIPSWNPVWATNEIFVVVGNSVIVVADGASWPIVVNGNTFMSGTSLSPDDETIIYARTPADTEICTIRPNGVDGKCQDFPGYHVLDFVWSSPAELYMIGYTADDAFDQAARSVFERSGYVTEYSVYPTLALSPDGLQLAFSGRQCDLDVINKRCDYPVASDIFLVDLTGPAVSDVTDAFPADFLSGVTVHFVDLRSDAILNLTNDPANDYAPVWLAP